MLDLSCNALKELPTSLGGLQQLTFLNVGGNALTSLPACITKLAQLRSLVVNDNTLVDAPDFSPLTELCALGKNVWILCRGF